MKAYADGREARAGIGRRMEFYSHWPVVHRNRDPAASSLQVNAALVN